jgi:DNA mismatch endonuclease (patch repair protein)
MMAGIRAATTKPEMRIRRGLHARGFRFRLHDRKLPGRPDLILPKYSAVIFVHGCFWHQHECELFKWPQTRREFWRDKIEGNARRDALAEARLRASGWRILKIWECALKGPSRLDPQELIERAATWLCSNDAEGEIRGDER